ncbi:hypothetical protein, partial [Pseudomonas poae]|uniref:hypothetical protein n=1 Tax=Pseudomonas poae TaxID=200451 RepID=UPI001F2F8099
KQRERHEAQRQDVLAFQHFHSRKYHTTESEFREGFPVDEGNAVGPGGGRPVQRSASFWDAGA